MTARRRRIEADSDVDSEALIPFSKLILGIKRDWPSLREQSLQELWGYGFIVDYVPAYRRGARGKVPRSAT